MHYTGTLQCTICTNSIQCRVQILYSTIYRHYTDTLMFDRLSLPVVVSVKCIALITTCFPLSVLWMINILMMTEMMMASKMVTVTDVTCPH